MSTRRPIVIGVAVVALVIVAFVLGSSGGDSRVTGPSLSPSSVGGDGTKALVLLLQHVGADVRLGDVVPQPDAEVALVLRDRLDSVQSEQLQAWVEAGGTLVVADPSSNLSALADSAVPADALVRGTCTVQGIDDVNRLDLGSPITGPDDAGGAMYQVAGAASCFGDGQTAYVVSTTRAQGTVISIGGANPLTNDLLDQADNSVLAVALLAPGDHTTIAVLDPNPAGRGSTGLIDLIPTRVQQGLLQLLVAFVVYALWRARRLGRPIVERQPVAIAGSRLVDAVGRLYRRTGSTRRAAADLRADLRRLLVQRYGLPANAPPDAVAEVITLRTGLDRERVRWAVGDTPINDEATLVALAAELDSIRQEVLHVRT
ncbi:MAG: hypothetical protein QOE63_1020 [Acidimicrobiaceae bacterium]